MSDLDLTAAVEAASWAETLDYGRLGDDIATAAVAAAAPVIAAMVAEAVLADVAERAKGRIWTFYGDFCLCVDCRSILARDYAGQVSSDE